MKIAKIFYILLLLFFFHTGSVSATDPTPRQPDKLDVDQLSHMSLEDLLSIDIPTVTSVSKRVEQATDAPGTVIVITKKDIKLRGYSQLVDVLRDLPGMETIEFYHSEYGTQVPVRGIIGNNKLIVLVNGMRVNPPGGEEMPFRSDISVRNAEQIEVTYGPGSTLYGADALSAVINIQTRAPVENAEGTVALSGGSHDFREGFASFGGSFGEDNKNYVTGYLQLNDSNLSDLDKEFPEYWSAYEEVAAPKGDGVDPVREDYGANAFLQAKLGEMTFQIWHRESSRSSSEGIRPALGFLDEAIWHDESTVAELQHVFDYSQSLSFETSLLYNRFEIDPESRFVFPANDTEWFLDDFKYGLGESVTAEETVRYAPDADWSFVAGLVASSYDILPKSTVPGGADTSTDIVSQAGNFVYFDSEGERHEVPRATNVNYENFGAYIEGAWNATEFTRLIAGFRVDYDSRFDEYPFLPRLALIQKLCDSLVGKLTYTEAYIAPAPYFSFATFANSAVLNTSNPDLDPEEGQMTELSFSFNEEYVTLGLSLFYGEQKNLIKSPNRGSQGVTIDDMIFLDEAMTQPLRLVQAGNGGNSKNYGVDFFGKAVLGPLQPWFSYSYVNYEEKFNEVATGLRDVSRHNFRLGTTWRALPSFFITPSLVARSTPEAVNAGLLGDKAEDPYEFNLHALYEVSEHVDFFATFRNITDHKYGLSGARGQAIPQEPFSGIAGVRVKL